MFLSVHRKKVKVVIRKKTIAKRKEGNIAITRRITHKASMKSTPISIIRASTPRKIVPHPKKAMEAFTNRDSILFMAIETRDDASESEDIEKEEESEGEEDVEVDLEEELICALDEIKRLRKKNSKKKLQLQVDSECKVKLSQNLEELEDHRFESSN